MAYTLDPPFLSADGYGRTLCGATFFVHSLPFPDGMSKEYPFMKTVNQYTQNALGDILRVWK
jgi:hypothetical protein